MKTLLTTITYALTSFVLSIAGEVSSGMAKCAVEHWLTADSSLGCRLGGGVASARTCTATNGAVFHVVKLSGGGFVVTSADTRIEPVVAFSESEDLIEDERNPLWTLLTQDLAVRAQVVQSKGGATLMSAAPVSSAFASAEAKWAKLLADGPTLMGVSSVSDVRVAPLVRSKWGQENNSIYSNCGDDCYNYYTPEHCVCGCVATAMAQIMRYHRFPDGTVTVAQRSFSCTLNGVSRSYTLKGGSYDWDRMPLVPEAYSSVDWYAGGATEEERRAIGKLTYDCGVAMRMDYSPDGSAAIGAFVFNPLKEVFHFANAHPLFGSISQQDCANAIFANLDAGCPVIVGLDGHEVVADGYGYSAQTPYTHLNMGWCGADDAWYALPIVDTSQFYSSAIHSITYNIFPKQTGELLTGRVLSSQGAPIAEATVDVKYNGATVASVTTDERGIYAVILTGNRAYAVCASAFGQTATISVSVGTSTDPSRINLTTGGWSGAYPVCGNSWGNDIRLSDVQGVAEPVFTPAGCLFHPSTNVAISCATSGATIRYTLDGTEPTGDSAVYSGPIFIDDDTTIRARAFMSGMNPSAVVSSTYTYDAAQGAPKGDCFDNPIVVSGASGSRKIVDTSAFTYEPGEPWHTSQGGGRYYEYRSAWFSWTAPGSGTMTFSADSKLVQGSSMTRFPVFLAVYTGDSLTSMSRLALATNRDDNYVTSLRLDVGQGMVYRIVIASGYEALSGYYNLQWSGSLTVVATATDSTDTTVSVPYEWLSGKLPARLPANPTAVNYTALALEDTDGDGFANWKEYLCGTEPLQRASCPQCLIAMNGDAPTVTHNIVVPADAASQGWTVRMLGSPTLQGNWETANPSIHHFFKVVVER